MLSVLCWVNPYLKDGKKHFLYEYKEYKVTL
jgi:hypothetical protein